MFRFTMPKQGIHNIICSRLRSTNNNDQEIDRHSGFDNKVFSIVVEEVENTAAGEFVIEKVKGRRFVMWIINLQYPGEETQAQP
jgi:hypothetical protein